MFDTITVVRLIQPIVSLFRRFRDYGVRLWKERQAGRKVFPDENISLMDEELDKTIARLR
jgi:hypothetical protein